LKVLILLQWQNFGAAAEILLMMVMIMKREYAQRAQTSAEHGMTQLVSNTEDPDFGLWTLGSEA